MSRSRVHFEGLDGLRAIGVVTVVVTHLRANLYMFGLENRGEWQYAHYGVTTFFALSGFLITYLLMRERRTAEIDVPRYYARRALRILPLYFAYLSLALITAYVFYPERLDRSVLHYLFLTANVPFAANEAFPRLEHFWSLAVEEQFYLAWPLVLRRVKDPLRVVGTLFVGFFTLRAAGHLLPAEHVFWTRFLEVSRFECVLIGAAAGILYERGDHAIVRFAQQRWVQLGCWTVYALLLLNSFRMPGLGHDFVAAVSVLVILAQITRVNRVVPLEAAPLRFVGRLSYGIYAIHPLVIFYWGRALRGVDLDPTVLLVVAHVLVFGTSLGLAALSYRYFEKPFLELKDRIRAPARAPAVAPL